MSEPIELTISGDPNDLSPNKRHHWRTRADLVKRWRTKAQIKAVEARLEPARGRVRISFTIRRGRVLDPDNARSSASLKACVDGLRDAGVIPNDTLKHVLIGEVIQETGGIFRHRPELVVRIEQVEDTNEETEAR